jgi:tetraacyldisaccharide 4'-kinase
MLGWLFSKIGNFRNLLYERGVFKSTPLGVPTFSIGNISVGGTGKTPLVSYVASLLAEKGEKVCILTRGYGRENARERVVVSDGENIMADAKKAGDEPLELARKLPGKAIVIADGDRVSAGLWAKEEFGITAFVLDDGFQHRRVERDLDIVCIDATNPFGSGKSMKPGLLREPPPNLARAGAIIITRADLAENLADLKSRISELAPGVPVFTASNCTSQLAELDSARTIGPKDIRSKKASAFCALGSPGNFFDQLRKEGFDLVHTEAFRDHHFYTQADIAELEIRARENGAEVFLTTAKDAVKLTGLEFELPCYVVESALVFDDEPAFQEMIYGFLSGGPFLSPQ